MKKLVYAALLLGGLSQATGCIITSSDDDGPGGGPGGGGGDTAGLGVAWSLDPGCPAGATTIRIAADDGSGALPFEDLTDCSAEGVFDVTDLPLGTYDVWIEVIDDDGALFAQSGIETVVLDVRGDIVEVPEFVVLTEEAFFQVEWALFDAATEVGLTCEEAAVDNVSLTASVIPQDINVDPFDSEWNCEDQAGITHPMPLGDYTIVMFANRPDGAALGATDSFEGSLVVGNEVVDLGLVEIPVD